MRDAFLLRVVALWVQLQCCRWQPEVTLQMTMRQCEVVSHAGAARAHLSNHRDFALSCPRERAARANHRVACMVPGIRYNFLLITVACQTQPSRGHHQLQLPLPVREHVKGAGAGPHRPPEGLDGGGVGWAQLEANTHPCTCAALG